jgi:hypothetical protein
MDFRTQFLRIVLQCLEDLKWPPCTRAFSDPLDDLIHDKHACYDAFLHIIAIGTQRGSIRSIDLLPASSAAAARGGSGLADAQSPPSPPKSSRPGSQRSKSCLSSSPITAELSTKSAIEAGDGASTVTPTSPLAGRDVPAQYDTPPRLPDAVDGGGIDALKKALEVSVVDLR